MRKQRTDVFDKNFVASMLFEEGLRAGVPLPSLFSWFYIMNLEGGSPYAVTVEGNKTRSYGPFQINDVHAEEIRKMGLRFPQDIYATRDLPPEEVRRRIQNHIRYVIQRDKQIRERLKALNPQLYNAVFNVEFGQVNPMALQHLIGYYMASWNAPAFADNVARGDFRPLAPGVAVYRLADARRRQEAFREAIQMWQNITQSYVRQQSERVYGEVSKAISAALDAGRIRVRTGRVPVSAVSPYQIRDAIVPNVISVIPQVSQAAKMLSPEHIRRLRQEFPEVESMIPVTTKTPHEYVAALSLIGELAKQRTEFAQAWNLLPKPVRQQILSTIVNYSHKVSGARDEKAKKRMIVEATTQLAAMLTPRGAVEETKRFASALGQEVWGFITGVVKEAVSIPAIFVAAAKSGELKKVWSYLDKVRSTRKGVDKVAAEIAYAAVHNNPAISFAWGGIVKGLAHMVGSVLVGIPEKIFEYVPDKVPGAKVIKQKLQEALQFIDKSLGPMIVSESIKLSKDPNFRKQHLDDAVMFLAASGLRHLLDVRAGRYIPTEQGWELYTATLLQGRVYEILNNALRTQTGDHWAFRLISEANLTDYRATGPLIGIFATGGLLGAAKLARMALSGIKAAEAPVAAAALAETGNLEAALMIGRGLGNLTARQRLVHGALATAQAIITPGHMFERFFTRVGLNTALKRMGIDGIEGLRAIAATEGYQAALDILHQVAPKVSGFSKIASSFITGAAYTWGGMPSHFSSPGEAIGHFVGGTLVNMLFDLPYIYHGSVELIKGTKKPRHEILRNPAFAPIIAAVYEEGFIQQALRNPDIFKMFIDPRILTRLHAVADLNAMERTFTPKKQSRALFVLNIPTENEVRTSKRIEETYARAYEALPPSDVELVGRMLHAYKLFEDAKEAARKKHKLPQDVEKPEDMTIEEWHREIVRIWGEKMFKEQVWGKKFDIRDLAKATAALHILTHARWFADFFYSEDPEAAQQMFRQVLWYGLNRLRSALDAVKDVKPHTAVEEDNLYHSIVDRFISEFYGGFPVIGELMKSLMAHQLTLFGAVKIAEGAKIAGKSPEMLVEQADIAIREMNRIFMRNLPEYLIRYTQGLSVEGVRELWEKTVEPEMKQQISLVVEPSTIVTYAKELLDELTAKLRKGRAAAQFVTPWRRMIRALNALDAAIRAEKRQQEAKKFAEEKAIEEVMKAQQAAEGQVTGEAPVQEPTTIEVPPEQKLTQQPTVEQVEKPTTPHGEGIIRAGVTYPAVSSLLKPAEYVPMRRWTDMRDWGDDYLPAPMMEDKITVLPNEMWRNAWMSLPERPANIEEYIRALDIATTSFALSFFMHPEVQPKFFGSHIPSIAIVSADLARKIKENPYYTSQFHIVAVDAGPVQERSPYETDEVLLIMGSNQHWTPESLRRFAQSVQTIFWSQKIPHEFWEFVLDAWSRVDKKDMPNIVRFLFAALPGINETPILRQRMGLDNDAVWERVVEFINEDPEFFYGDWLKKNIEEIVNGIIQRELTHFGVSPAFNLPERVIDGLRAARSIFPLETPYQAIANAMLIISATPIRSEYHSRMLKSPAAYLVKALVPDTVRGDWRETMRTIREQFFIPYLQAYLFGSRREGKVEVVEGEWDIRVDRNTNTVVFSIPPEEEASFWAYYALAVQTASEFYDTRYLLPSRTSPSRADLFNFSPPRLFEEFIRSRAPQQVVDKLEQVSEIAQLGRINELRGISLEPIDVAVEYQSIAGFAWAVPEVTASIIRSHTEYLRDILRHDLSRSPELLRVIERISGKEGLDNVVEWLEKNIQVLLIAQSMAPVAFTLGPAHDLPIAGAFIPHSFSHPARPLKSFLWFSTLSSLISKSLHEVFHLITHVDEQPTFRTLVDALNRAEPETRRNAILFILNLADQLLSAGTKWASLYGVSLLYLLKSIDPQLGKLSRAVIPISGDFYDGVISALNGLESRVRDLAKPLGIDADVMFRPLFDVTGRLKDMLEMSKRLAAMVSDGLGVTFTQTVETARAFLEMVEQGTFVDPQLFAQFARAYPEQAALIRQVITEQVVNADLKAIKDMVDYYDTTNTPIDAVEYFARREGIPLDEVFRHREYLLDPTEIMSYWGYDFSAIIQFLASKYPDEFAAFVEVLSQVYPASERLVSDAFVELVRSPMTAQLYDQAVQYIRQLGLDTVFNPRECIKAMFALSARLGQNINLLDIITPLMDKIVDDTTARWLYAGISPIIPTTLPHRRFYAKGPSAVEEAMKRFPELFEPKEEPTVEPKEEPKVEEPKPEEVTKPPEAPEEDRTAEILQKIMYRTVLPQETVQTLMKLAKAPLPQIRSISELQSRLREAMERFVVEMEAGVKVRYDDFMMKTIAELPDDISYPQFLAQAALRKSNVDPVARLLLTDERYERARVIALSLTAQVFEIFRSMGFLHPLSEAVNFMQERTGGWTKRMVNAISARLGAYWNVVEQFLTEGEQNRRLQRRILGEIGVKPLSAKELGVFLFTKAMEDIQFIALKYADQLLTQIEQTYTRRVREAVRSERPSLRRRLISLLEKNLLPYIDRSDAELEGVLSRAADAVVKLSRQPYKEYLPIQVDEGQVLAQVAEKLKIITATLKQHPPENRPAVLRRLIGGILDRAVLATFSRKFTEKERAHLRGLLAHAIVNDIINFTYSDRVLSTLTENIAAMNAMLRRRLVPNPFSSAEQFAKFNGLPAEAVNVVLRRGREKWREFVENLYSYRSLADVWKAIGNFVSEVSAIKTHHQIDVNPFGEFMLMYARDIVVPKERWEPPETALPPLTTRDEVNRVAETLPFSYAELAREPSDVVQLFVGFKNVLSEVMGWMSRILQSEMSYEPPETFQPPRTFRSIFYPVLEPDKLFKHPVALSSDRIVIVALVHDILSDILHGSEKDSAWERGVYDAILRNLSSFHKGALKNPAAVTRLEGDEAVLWGYAKEILKTDNTVIQDLQALGYGIADAYITQITMGEAIDIFAFMQERIQRGLAEIIQRHPKITDLLSQIRGSDPEKAQKFRDILEGITMSYIAEKLTSELIKERKPKHIHKPWEELLTEEDRQLFNELRNTFSILNLAAVFDRADRISRRLLWTDPQDVRAHQLFEFLDAAWHYKIMQPIRRLPVYRYSQTASLIENAQFVLSALPSLLERGLISIADRNKAEVALRKFLEDASQLERDPQGRLIMPVEIANNLFRALNELGAKVFRMLAYNTARVEIPAKDQHTLEFRYFGDLVAFAKARSILGFEYGKRLKEFYEAYNQLYHQIPQSMRRGIPTPENLTRVAAAAALESVEYVLNTSKIDENVLTQPIIEVIAGMFQKIFAYYDNQFKQLRSRFATPQTMEEGKRVVVKGEDMMVYAHHFKTTADEFIKAITGLGNLFNLYHQVLDFSQKEYPRTIGVEYMLEDLINAWITFGAPRREIRRKQLDDIRKQLEAVNEYDLPEEESIKIEHIISSLDEENIWGMIIGVEDEETGEIKRYGLHHLSEKTLNLPEIREVVNILLEYYRHRMTHWLIGQRIGHFPAPVKEAIIETLRAIAEQRQSAKRQIEQITQTLERMDAGRILTKFLYALSAGATLATVAPYIPELVFNVFPAMLHDIGRGISQMVHLSMTNPMWVTTMLGGALALLFRSRRLGGISNILGGLLVSISRWMNTQLPNIRQALQGVGSEIVNKITTSMGSYWGALAAALVNSIEVPSVYNDILVAQMTANTVNQMTFKGSFPGSGKPSRQMAEDIVNHSWASAVLQQGSLLGAAIHDLAKATEARLIMKHGIPEFLQNPNKQESLIWDLAVLKALSLLSRHGQAALQQPFKNFYKRSPIALAAASVIDPATGQRVRLALTTNVAEVTIQGTKVVLDNVTLGDVIRYGLGGVTTADVDALFNATSPAAFKAALRRLYSNHRAALQHRIRTGLLAHMDEKSVQAIRFVSDWILPIAKGLMLPKEKPYLAVALANSREAQLAYLMNLRYLQLIMSLPFTRDLLAPLGFDANSLARELNAVWSSLAQMGVPSNIIEEADKAMWQVKATVNATVKELMKRPTSPQAAMKRIREVLGQAQKVISRLFSMVAYTRYTPLAKQMKGKLAPTMLGSPFLALEADLRHTTVRMYNEPFRQDFFSAASSTFPDEILALPEVIQLENALNAGKVTPMQMLATLESRMDALLTELAQASGRRKEEIEADYNRILYAVYKYASNTVDDAHRVHRVEDVFAKGLVALNAPVVLDPRRTTSPAVAQIRTKLLKLAVPYAVLMNYLVKMYAMRAFLEDMYVGMEPSFGLTEERYVPQWHDLALNPGTVLADMVLQTFDRLPTKMTKKPFEFKRTGLAEINDADFRNIMRRGLYALASKHVLNKHRPVVEAVIGFMPPPFKQMLAWQLANTLAPLRVGEQGGIPLTYEMGEDIANAIQEMFSLVGQYYLNQMRAMEGLPQDKLTAVLSAFQTQSLIFQLRSPFRQMGSLIYAGSALSRDFNDPVAFIMPILFFPRALKIVSQYMTGKQPKLNILERVVLENSPELFSRRSVTERAILEGAREAINTIMMHPEGAKAVEILLDPTASRADKDKAMDFIQQVFIVGGEPTRRNKFKSAVSKWGFFLLRLMDEAAVLATKLAAVHTYMAHQDVTGTYDFNTIHAAINYGSAFSERVHATPLEGYRPTLFRGPAERKLSIKHLFFIPQVFSQFLVYTFATADNFRMMLGDIYDNIVRKDIPLKEKIANLATAATAIMALQLGTAIFNGVWVGLTQRVLEDQPIGIWTKEEEERDVLGTFEGMAAAMTKSAMPRPASFVISYFLALTPLRSMILKKTLLGNLTERDLPPLMRLGYRSLGETISILSNLTAISDTAGEDKGILQKLWDAVTVTYPREQIPSTLIDLAQFASILAAPYVPEAGLLPFGLVSPAVRAVIGSEELPVAAEITETFAGRPTAAKIVQSMTGIPAPFGYSEIWSPAPADIAFRSAERSPIRMAYKFVNETERSTAAAYVAELVRVARTTRIGPTLNAIRHLLNPSFYLAIQSPTRLDAVPEGVSERHPFVAAVTKLHKALQSPTEDEFIAFVRNNPYDFAWLNVMWGYDYIMDKWISGAGKPEWHKHYRNTNVLAAALASQGMNPQAVSALVQILETSKEHNVAKFLDAHIIRLRERETLRQTVRKRARLQHLKGGGS